nr:hypothetical transcript [Hymenolepis microstoma]
MHNPVKKFDTRRFQTDAKELFKEVPGFQFRIYGYSRLSAKTCYRLWHDMEQVREEDANIYCSHSAKSVQIIHPAQEP